MMEQPLWKQLWTMPHNNRSMYASFHKSLDDAMQFMVEEQQVQELAERQRILNPVYSCQPVGAPEPIDIEPYGIRPKLDRTIGVVVEL